MSEKLLAIYIALRHAFLIRSVGSRKDVGAIRTLSVMIVDVDNLDFTIATIDEILAAEGLGVFESQIDLFFQGFDRAGEVLTIRLFARIGE